MQELISQYKTRKKEVNNYLKKALWLLFQVCILFLTILLLQRLLIGVGVVHGVSMEPTFTEGDRVIFVCTGYEPERGDIVLCRSGKGYEEELIKRVIGVPGDVIDIDERSGAVCINGKLLKESYLNSDNGLVGDVTYPLVVPPGQYFVMGDNRMHSLDSRSSEIGTIERERIDGKVIWRIFPLSKFGKIE